MPTDSGLQHGQDLGQTLISHLFQQAQQTSLEKHLQAERENRSQRQGGQRAQGEQNLPGRPGLLVAHRGVTQSSEGYVGQVWVSFPHRHNPHCDWVKVHPHKAQLGTRSLCPAHTPSKPRMLCGVECSQAQRPSALTGGCGQAESSLGVQRDGGAVSISQHQLPGLTLV